MFQLRFKKGLSIAAIAAVTSVVAVASAAPTISEGNGDSLLSASTIEDPSVPRNRRLATWSPTTSSSESSSASPSASPTQSSNKSPTYRPTKSPTESPTIWPSETQSPIPTKSPTEVPTPTTWSPTEFSNTWYPKSSKSAPPSGFASTKYPKSRKWTKSDFPTTIPSDVPSDIPSGVPSIAPSSGPSDAPSLRPTITPSVTPSAVPSTVPSAAPSAAPSSSPSMGCDRQDVRSHPFCTNDPLFLSMGKAGRDCAWFAANPMDRCQTDSRSEISCPEVCNPRCIRCDDNPDYRNGDHPKRSCEWVAQKPEARCSLSPNEEPMCECRDTCNPICQTKCENNKHYRQRGISQRTCDWIASDPKKLRKRCNAFKHEAWFGCPETCNPECADY